MRNLLFAILIIGALFVSMEAYSYGVIAGTEMTVVCTLVCLYAHNRLET